MQSFTGRAALIRPHIANLSHPHIQKLRSPNRVFRGLNVKEGSGYQIGKLCCNFFMISIDRDHSEGGEGQNCKGQKCTEHELVLLMFFVLKRLDDLLWSFKMPLVGLLWLLVHHQINSGSNKLLMEVVKSAQSTSSCFCFNSYVGWPKSLLEL